MQMKNGSGLINLYRLAQKISRYLQLGLKIIKFWFPNKDCLDIASPKAQFLGSAIQKKNVWKSTTFWALIVFLHQVVSLGQLLLTVPRKNIKMSSILRQKQKGPNVMSKANHQLRMSASILIPTKDIFTYSSRVKKNMLNKFKEYSKSLTSPTCKLFFTILGKHLFK